MRIETSLKARNRMKTSVADLYNSARLFGMSAEDIQTGVMAITGDKPTGTPAWVTSFISGYCEALNDDLYRNHLIFGGWVNGNFYSVHSNRPDYYGRNGIEPSQWAVDGFARCLGHYWDKTTPHRGGTYDRGGFKPYFISVKEGN